MAALTVVAGCGAAVAAVPGTKLFGGEGLSPEAAYFVGHWGMGSADECADSDTMSFYASGAWAVTNGGGNPVEAIGAWSFADGTMTIVYSELGEPDAAESVSGPVQQDGDDVFSLAVEGSPEPLYRCN